VIDLLPYVALAVGFGACLGWSVAFGLVIANRARGVERRAVFAMMCGTALLASIGATASAWGYAQGTGVVPVIDRNVIALLGSIGRGALLMASLIVITHGLPRKDSD
jgi:hypothetical protein